jgi:peptidoglycan/LPS O-acetylase OafA/YrhL
MAMLKRPNLPALTGLRFLLALLIVFEHQSGPEGMLQLSTRPIAPWLANLFESGYAAVGFFFMLSGFVLAYGYNLAAPWNGAERRRFYLARVARIYPVYALGLLLALPFTLAALGHVALQHGSLKAAPFVLAPVLLQSWLPSAAGLWNGPGWSLSDEAFFYAVFPLAGWLLWKVRGVAWPAALAAFFWLYMLASVSGLAHVFLPQLLRLHGATFADPTRWVAILNFNPLINLPEFLIGILAAKIFLALHAGSGPVRTGRGAWLYIPAIVVELLVLTHADKLPYPWMHSGLLLPAHAALIIGLGLGGGVVPRALGTRTMLLLGQSSYALYLIHGPLKSIWMVAGARWGLPIVGYGWFALYTVAAVGASIAVFLWVEEPMRRLILRRFGTPGRKVHLAFGEAVAAN